MFVKKFIDRGFKPDISTYAGSDGLAVIERWGIDVEGRPVEMPRDQRAAVWFGSKFNLRDETPALMVVVEKEDIEDPSHRGSYFYGVVFRSMIDSVTQVSEAVADSAVYRAPTPDVIDITGSLAKAALVTVDSYITLKPDEEDPLGISKVSVDSRFL